MKRKIKLKKMPSSPIDRFPLSDSSKSNSFNCSPVPENYKQDITPDLKNGVQYFQCPDLLQKSSEKPSFLSSQRTSRRRFTFSGHPEHKILHKKRRRFTTVIRPTKFLLGGNSSDPLNLSGLQDETINSQLSVSPASSPMPHPTRRNQVQLIIPSNINDPLNLTTEDDIELTVLMSKTKKRRRNRKGRREDENEEMDQISPSDEVPPFDLAQGLVSSDAEKEISESSNDEVNRAVSVCRNSPVKINFRRSFSRSISKDVEVKHSSVSEKSSKTHDTDLKHLDSKKYKSNAEKFCYGNREINLSNWNNGRTTEVDPRLRFFDKNMFYGKDVLDIGCNTGKMTMHIAKHLFPRKVVGIDIDRKLISRALRKVRFEESKNIEKEKKIDFPSSLAVMFGPLTKLALSCKKSPMEFPSNISFLEANYVPACEDYLETQKPEYDTILCLRVTKWIHLNFGDEGLKMAFKRMYAQLRHGGRLILEPQPWFTYSASKRITPAIKSTYNSLQMRPDSFCEYLLSEVGFTSCETIGRTFHCAKAYRQDILLFTKGCESLSKRSEVDPSSPISFHVQG